MCGKLISPSHTVLEALALTLGPTRYVIDDTAILDRIVHPEESVHAFFDWRGETNLAAMRWGFQKAKMYNCRSDEVDKPAWAQSFATNRCVVPAAAFVEKGTSFSADEAGGLFIAALYGVTPQTHKFCVALLTMAATDQVASIHRRMPVLLPMEQVLAWISPRRHNNATPLLNACIEYTQGTTLDTISSKGS